MQILDPARALGLALLCCGLVTPAARGAAPPCGDLSRDGVVGFLDATFLRAHLVGALTLDEEQSLRCNVIDETEDPNITHDPNDLATFCSMADAVVMRRNQDQLPPPPAPVCPLASSQACTQPGPLPGCDDPATVLCVCDLEPGCCTGAWDAGCALLASSGACALACGNGQLNAGEECDADADCPPAQACTPGGLPGACQCGDVIGHHDCVLDPNSFLIVDFGISNLPVSPTGNLEVACGGVDPNTGKAACFCEAANLDPLDLRPIGFICLTPFAGCSPGEIDCDGGNALDTDLTSEHTIGTCTSNPDCASQCAAFCPPGSQAFDPGCEGYCDGGTNDGTICTGDSDCPGGSCPGPDGGHVTQHECGCSCASVGGSPAPAGGLQCNLGVEINVESGIPCGDGDVTIAIGGTCIPMTTQTSTGIIHNPNLLGGTLGGAALNGVPGDCAALAASVPSGTVIVGQVNFFDSTLGDLNVLLSMICQ